MKHLRITSLEAGLGEWAESPQKAEQMRLRNHNLSDEAFGTSPRGIQGMN